jgi:hypothetical protein
MCHMSPYCMGKDEGLSNADGPIIEKTWPQANPGTIGMKPAFIEKKTGEIIELDCSNGCDECLERGLCDPEAYRT